MAIFLTDDRARPSDLNSSPVWNRSDPDNNLSWRGLIKRAGFSEPCGVKLLGIVQVCREKHVERCTILQLQRKVAGGAVDQFHALSRFLLETRPNFLRRKLQVGCHRY